MFKKLILICTLFALLGFDSYSKDLIGANNTYVVKRGDTVKNISSRYGITCSQLLKINKIRDPNVIKPGQSLKISSQKIIPKKIYNGIIINLPEYQLYHFKNGVLLDSYPIAIGKTSWKTPRGRFFIDNKTLNPTWRVPPLMLKRYRNKYKRKTVPPGPDNPLGKYWIGLSIPHIGIHSTNKPYSIGQPRSHGCMRLNTTDAEKLFNSIDLGTQGEIIYDPVKIGAHGGKIFIEVHEDVYGINGDPYASAVKKLKQSNLVNNVDLETVRKAVNEKEGIPVVISKLKTPHFKYSSPHDFSVKKSSDTQLWNELALD